MNDTQIFIEVVNPVQNMTFVVTPGVVQVSFLETQRAVFCWNLLSAVIIHIICLPYYKDDANRDDTNTKVVYFVKFKVRCFRGRAARGGGEVVSAAHSCRPHCLSPPWATRTATRVRVGGLPLSPARNPIIAR